MFAASRDACLPHITDLPSCSDSELAQLLDYLFEPSPAVHSTLLPVVRDATYSSYPGLIDAFQARLMEIALSMNREHPNETLLSILGSHPRLGEKNVESVQSASEQANLKHNASQSETQKLVRLNKEYEEAFPGLRYVVFVNGRGRPEIFEDMRKRIVRRDFLAEVHAALQVRRVLNSVIMSGPRCCRGGGKINR